MLSQSQIDFFHANGYLIMKSLFSGGELKSLQAAANRVIDEGIARINPQTHRYMAGADGSEVYWRSEDIWQRDAVFRAATVHPDLLENIGQCVGRPFFPWNDSLVVKLPANGAPVPWHQDPPYRNPDRKTTFRIPNFTTDIYLDHSTPENGCVYAIPGRHLEGHIPLESFTQEQLFHECGAIPLIMEPGDVLFHALSTPHGSGGNRSGGMRRVLYLHYLTQEVYEDGYAMESWAAEKPGLTNQRREQIAEMLHDRERLGLETTAQRSSVNWTADGFDFDEGLW